jgi:hypothetical protein
MILCNFFISSFGTHFWGPYYVQLNGWVIFVHSIFGNLAPCNPRNLIKSSAMASRVNVNRTFLGAEIYAASQRGARYI